MATHSELISLFRNLPRRGNGLSDDNEYSDVMLAFIVDYYRAALIKQDVDKGKYLTEYYTQNLGKVSLIKADPNECCDIDPYLNCILRTAEKIPKVVDTNGKNLFTFVGDLSGKAYQRTTYNKAQFSSYSKYTGKLPKWYQLGDYIYLVNPPSSRLKYINIQGIFEHPQKANEFKTCICDNELECFIGYDYEYPMSDTKIDTMIKMFASAELAMNSILQRDDLNNTNDDNTAQR